MSEHGHEHGDPHQHGDSREQSDPRGHGRAGRVRHLLRPHSHEPSEQVDAALEGSAAGLRVLWISLAVLGATALVQAGITVVSGSVALLGDTLHNAADALTAVPLGIAFLAARRPASRQYTYGYGRAEGCASNEVVARYRIRAGRRIGSAALVADGLHARADGFASLAVLLAAGGAALGWTWADPLVGLLITVAILAAARPAAREIYRRLMDAVDPALVDAAETALRDTPGVLGTGAVRLRWIGHRLRAECEVLVAADVSAVAAHQVAAAAEHNLRHALPHLAGATVHADPGPAAGTDHHALLAAHR
jgi:divalent metal cation (Fe/Co/Zn/Cd) transporter